jgi:hypothetical protein
MIHFFSVFQQVTMYGSKLWEGTAAEGSEVEIPGMSPKAIVHSSGMLLFGNDGKAVS